jgi:hypothetical protein
MAISLAGSVTGTAQTGFTTPGFTIVTDQPPAWNAKQWAISALTGTQTGASATSQSSPFIFIAYRPVAFTPVGRVNPQGVLVNNGFNNWAFVVKKGMIPLAGQAPQVATFTLNMKIPAGADLASPGEIKSALSLLFGAVTQVSAGTGDSLISGTM